MAKTIVKLTAQSACYGLLPMAHGSVKVREIIPDHMTSIAPFKGQASALNKMLMDAHGVKYPAAGRVVTKEGVRCQWVGHAHAMLIGPAAARELAHVAAVTDQTDAWAIVKIQGADVEQVLARVIPMDLRAKVFKTHHTARTMVQHMAASVTRVGPDAFEIMVMRSMARTLVHDLETAMENVAAHF